FLYEGVSKLLAPGWSAEGFLRAGGGPLAGAFRYVADHPALLKIVDPLNMWALTIIGAALMLGLFTRAAAVAGMILVVLYYLACPPWFGPPAAANVEGNYLLVNKNLVELLALLVILAMPATGFGLDGILMAGRARRRAEAGGTAAGGARVSPASNAPEPPGLRPHTIVMNLAPPGLSRRRILAGLAGLPFIGGFVLAVLKRHGWFSHEEANLALRVDARTGATLKKFDFSASLADLKGRLPTARLGHLELSRVMLGGNLIGGWAHARDLLYVSKLIKAYHHRQKVFETLRLAESAGVNAIITNPLLCDVINDYWRSTGGKIRFISDCGGSDVLAGARESIDRGACACYVHGGVADGLVARGDFDTIARTLELIRRNGLPAGIAGHKLRTVRACVEKGLLPDFWMKTLHHANYWSAKPAEEHDNTWCDDPEGTIAFMGTLKQPWIAYKILAAGAIEPRDGFRYAFANGADFICVGMYDFQIIEDVNLALDVLADKDKLNRRRDWMA
ncbi:MAG: DoxX family protein, partial [Phycisphaerae bacterium]